MARYRPSVPSVQPYTGPLEPDEPNEPNEPMPTRMKVDAFINKIKEFENTDKVPFKSTNYRDENYPTADDYPTRNFRDENYSTMNYGSMRFIPESQIQKGYVD